MAETQTTRLGRSWIIKMAIFFVVAIVLGTWGLLDAKLFYPKRGLGYASQQLGVFLQAAQDARQLTPEQVGMADPAVRFADLSVREIELQNKVKTSPESVEGRDANAELSRLKWLEALSSTWVIKQDRVPIEIPEPGPGKPHMTATHFDLHRGVGLAVAPDGSSKDVPLNTVRTELREKWDRTDAPSKLASYDLYVQWLFVIAGYACGLWVLLKVVRASGKRYHWAPESQTLTLPGGKSVTPADLAEIDKRKWHKFFCTLEFKDGSTHTCDLLKYQPLEEWVLEMEQTAFPERAAEAEADEEQPESAEAAPASE